MNNSYAMKNSPAQNKYMPAIGDRFKVEARISHLSVLIHMHLFIYELIADYRI